MSMSDSESVCLSVHEHISETPCPNFTKFLVHFASVHGSVFLWQNGNMFCTSGFVDDIMCMV